LLTKSKEDDDQVENGKSNEKENNKIKWWGKRRERKERSESGSGSGSWRRRVESRSREAGKPDYSSRFGRYLLAKSKWSSNGTVRKRTRERRSLGTLREV
jgi:hypothetical protein